MQSRAERKWKEGGEGVVDTWDELCRGGLLAAAEACVWDAALWSLLRESWVPIELQHYSVLPNLDHLSL